MSWRRRLLNNGVTAPALRCAIIGAARAAIMGIYYAIQGGSTSPNGFQGTLNRMGEEAVLWGTAGAVYGITQYGLELDSVKDFIACAVTSAVISAVLYKNSSGAIVTDSYFFTFVTGIAYSAYNHATGKVRVRI